MILIQSVWNAGLTVDDTDDGAEGPMDSFIEHWVSSLVPIESVRNADLT
jgi:hypothetical protein